MAYLIDTDIIIFALRGDKTVLAKFEENKTIPISISMVTYAELVFGAKRSQNEQTNMIKVNHIREIYPIEELNVGVMEVFADIKVKMYAKAIRIRIEDMDLFIAATAMYNDLTLVANNTKHFENIPGLKLENWKRS
jgi:vapC-like nucleic acid-binding protein